jgi:hypothetical protein
VGGQGVGAFNQRCTNYIVSNQRPTEEVVIQDSSGRVIIGGGVAGRTPAATAFGNTLCVSFHSSARKWSNADTSALLLALQRNPDYRRYSHVIIGGDFNTAPGNVEDMLQPGTARSRPSNIFQHTEVVSTGELTHPSSNAELDYFAVLSQQAFDSPDAQMIETRLPSGQRVSDHNMVQSEVDLS